MTRRTTALTIACMSSLCALPAAAQVEVRARAETEPVPNGGDAADDPAIWIHPDDPAASLVVGTDKQGGLALYDLEGAEVAYVPDGDMNNVDLRYGFPLGGELVDLVTAGNRTGDRIAVYRLDPEERTLLDVSAGDLPAGLTVYGSCMYRSAATGELYFFVNSKAGEVVQWRLYDDGGRVGAEEARRFDVGGQTEGCVADDELGHLYIGEENVGIWRYGAEPESGDARVEVDRTGGGGNLAADVEGLALYLAPDGAGYLVASSQGDNSYAVYERAPDNAHLGSFRVVDGEVDGTNDTDGLDVSSAALGASFPSGLIVVQDGSNDGGNQNYKLVAWEDVATAFSPMLAIDTSHDPRGTTEPMPEPDAGVVAGVDGGGGGPEPDAGGLAPRRDAGSGGSTDSGRHSGGASSGGCSASGADAARATAAAWLLVLLLLRRRR